MNRSSHLTGPGLPGKALPRFAFRCGGLATVLAAVMALAAGTGTARAQNELFVTNALNNSVTVYDRSASGNMAPLRTISGAATGLIVPQGVTVDTVNDELVVSDTGAIRVYARTASGNVAPLRAIALLGSSRGVAVDTVHDELVVASASTIKVYARTADGSVLPLRTIQGAATLLNNPQGLAVDTANDELVVANINNAITVYSRTASGNVAPLRTISGAATGLNSPRGLSLDTVNNEIAVANSFTPSLTVYGRTASGNVAPLRTISGAATGLFTPIGLAVDVVNNEFAVASFSGNAVSVFARTASGNAAPLRILSVAATALKRASFVATSVGCPPITLSPAALPAGTVGVTYGPTTITPTAGLGPYTFNVTGLPAGMTPTSPVIGASVTIGGTPAASFGGTVTVSGTDVGACPFSQDFSLTIGCVSYPSATVTAPAQVCPSSTGNAASVPDAGPGATYAWTITNGTITAGAATRSITFSATRATPVHLSVTVTLNGCSATGPADVTVGGACPQMFYTLTPCRLLDTRDPDGPYGGPALISGGTDRSFVFAGQCGIPPEAVAVSVNVVVVQPTNGPGFLTFYPGGTVLPLLSTINYKAGLIQANNTTLTLGVAGDVSVHCQQGGGTAHLVVDTNGYFQ